MTQHLAPVGLRLVADRGLRRTDGGCLLIGGAPLRLVRLSSRGAAVVDEWSAGSPVADDRAARRLARRLLANGMMHPVVEPVAAVDVTVVIPVRDDAEGLERCLATVGDYPVVVVDDGSIDEASVSAIARSHGARLIRRAVAGGPGPARGDGVAAVETNLVAMIDADVEATPDWLERLAGHFVDPGVAVVAPRVRSRSGSGLRDRYERDHSPLDLGDVRSAVGPGRVVAYVPTAAMIVRAEVFRRLGGFDADLRWGEDVDFVWRVLDAGHGVRYEPDVEVDHAPRASWRAWFDQRRHYGSTAAPLGRRHPGKVAPVRCSAWSMAAWGAVAARHPFVGAGVAAGTTAALVPKLSGVPEPVREAIRLAGPGHVHAGVGLARAATRVWWPIVVLVAAARPRLRGAVVASFLVPAALDWVQGRRPAGLLTSVAVRIADDLAYGVGVWEGSIRHRTAVALAPDLRPWPGSAHAVERGSVAAT